MKIFLSIWVTLALQVFVPSNDTNNTSFSQPEVLDNEVAFWLTKTDQSQLLVKQPILFSSIRANNSFQTIVVDASETYQTVDGFGFSLTGGSAQVINQLSVSKKQELLQELFGFTEKGISISYLRVSMGASDLDETTFSYDDMPIGKTDTNLTHFTLAPDQKNLIPLLKEILIINPKIKILASPWSSPVWMKDKQSTKGGSLQPNYYGVYAKYFVKYIQKMKEAGITIDAITPQNEPLHPGNNPSMLMLAPQQADFIKNYLGQAFETENITTKIIIYDHNCDKPEYPISILNDPKAKTYIDGSAFHLYGGNISALSTVHQAHPDKNLYFTEQWISSTSNFGGDLQWHMKNVIIGSMRNWSKTALEWNLANNSHFGPHTVGGCDACRGGITIEDSSSFSRNVGYYIIAHASKFVPVGSTRIGSTIPGNLSNVAFRTPKGKIVVIVLNESEGEENFTIKLNEKWVTSALPGGSVGTYTW